MPAHALGPGTRPVSDRRARGLPAAPALRRGCAGPACTPSGRSRPAGAWWWSTTATDAGGRAPDPARRIRPGGAAIVPARSPSAHPEDGSGSGAPVGGDSAALPLALSTAAAAWPGSGRGWHPGCCSAPRAPVFRRACNALFRQSRLNVNVLDASAATVLLSQAQFGTAAIMVWLISLGDLLRNYTMRRRSARSRGCMTASTSTPGSCATARRFASRSKRSRSARR